MRKDSPKLIPELKVTDFQKSLDFYVGVLGFGVLYDRPEHEFAMLDREGARIMIESLSSTSRLLKVAGMEYPFGRGMHFQIEVSNIQELYEKVVSVSYPVFHEMEDGWYRTNVGEVGNRQFWIQDPDGYLLRFFEDLGTR